MKTIVIPQFYRGPSGQKGLYNRQEVGLARAFAALGCRAVVLYPEPGAKAPRIETPEPNVKICYMPAVAFGGQAFYKSWQILLDEHADAVHVMGDNSLGVPGLYRFCQKHGILFYSQLGALKSTSNHAAVRRVMDLLLCRNLAVYRKTPTYAKTPAVAAELESLGVPCAGLMPVGLDTAIIPSIPNNRTEIRRALKIDEHARVFIFVGRLDPYKQPLDLVPLLQAAPDWYAIIIGRGSLGDELTRRLTDAGLLDRCRLHAKKVKLGPDCDFGVVARMTPGASGAELANIVNEAALCAVRHHRKAVTQFDLQEAVDTILAGAQKKNKILNNKEKCIVSYHEVGHALVAALQTNSAPVQKITIVPRTSGALGFTMQVEDGDHTLMTKEEILNKIATLTGGRAAEELIFHSITTGASNDIEQATKLARALVTRYGMTEDFDMVALETVNNAYLGGDASLACSEQTAAQVDAKVVEIVQAEHKKAYQMLADNKRKLDEIAQYLYEKETISGEEFMRILNAQPQLPAGPSADSTNQAQ